MGKYGYLPGDIPATPAAQFGFAARGSNAGEGDGNGIISGWNGSSGVSWVEAGGETAMFWVDLSTAVLIEGSFNTASSTTNPAAPGVTGSRIGNYLPSAKVGRGNYVYVSNYNSQNMFLVSSSTGLSLGGEGALWSSGGNIVVSEAYSMDKKLDDGLPQSGNVMALYINGAGPMFVGTQNTAATPATSTTCYDNGGVAGTQNYSVTTNGGAGANCALSIQFQ